MTTFFPLNVWKHILQYSLYDRQCIYTKCKIELTVIFNKVAFVYEYENNNLIDDHSIYRWSYTYNEKDFEKYHQFYSKYIQWKSSILKHERTNPLFISSFFVPLERYIRAIERIFELKIFAQRLNELYYSYYIPLLRYNMKEALQIDEQQEIYRYELYKKLMFKYFLVIRFLYVVEFELFTVKYVSTSSSLCRDHNTLIPSLRLILHSDTIEPSIYAFDNESRYYQHDFVDEQHYNNSESLIDLVKKYFYLPITQKEYEHLYAHNGNLSSCTVTFVDVCDDLYEAYMNPYILRDKVVKLNPLPS